MFVPNRELGEFLIDARLISRAEFARLLEENNTNLFDTIFTRALVPEDELLRAAASVLGVPFLELHRDDISPEALMLVPEPLARTHSLAVFATRGHEAHAALLNLDALPHLEFLETERHLRVVPHLTDRASLKRALLLQQNHLKEKYATRLKDTSPDAVLDALLSHARLSHAREIHIEENQGAVRARYRIGNKVYEAMQLPGNTRALVGRLKELANLSHTLTMPQEGRFKVTLKNGEMLRVGVSLLPTHAGERVLLSVIHEANTKRGFAPQALGLHGEALERAHEFTHLRSGLVVVSGPKASGKTTALYTLLDMAAATHKVAISVEEKIELILPHISQTLVRKELGQTTASAVRAALKHNPDILLIGEIVDEETALLAANAASRGILVFAGVKSASAGAAIRKLLSFDIPPLLLSVVLSGVVASRVVRTLCPHCKETYTATRAELEPLEAGKGSVAGANFGRVLAALKAEGIVESGVQWKELQFYRPRGCAQCKSGYQGQTGLFEVLPVLAITKELIVQNNKEQDTHLGGEVPLNLAEDGLFKALQGLTSVEEVKEALGL